MGSQLFRCYISALHIFKHSSLASVKDIPDFHFGEGLSRDLGTLVFKTLLITFETLALSQLIIVSLILKGRIWGDDLLEEHCSKLSSKRPLV